MNVQCQAESSHIGDIHWYISNAIIGGLEIGVELHRDRRGGLRTPDGALERATGGGIDRLRWRHGGRPRARLWVLPPPSCPGLGSAPGAGGRRRPPIPPARSSPPRL